MVPGCEEVYNWELQQSVHLLPIIELPVWSSSHVCRSFFPSVTHPINDGLLATIIPVPSKTIFHTTLVTKSQWHYCDRHWVVTVLILLFSYTAGHHTLYPPSPQRCYSCRHETNVGGQVANDVSLTDWGRVWMPRTDLYMLSDLITAINLLLVSTLLLTLPTNTPTAHLARPRDTETVGLDSCLTDNQL